MAARKPAQRWEIALRVDGGTRTIELTALDFVALNAMAEGGQEVKKRTVDFERLRKLGLVKHRFTDEEWPRAVIELTGLGRQALAQDTRPR
jgi:hypothetical protein